MATLADYEDQVEAVPVGGGKFAGDLKELPNGNYEFGISGVTYKVIASSGSELVELKLEVLTEGQFQGKKFQHPYWLTDKDDGGINEVTIGILKKDLKTLGFDVDDWKKANGRPFVGELKKAVKILNGGSFAFKAEKKMKDKYAQLFISKRSETDGRPATFNAESMNKFSSQPFDAEGDY